MAYKRKSAEIYGPSKKSSKIDLNYPFTSSSSTSITPPFVNAPFYDENGQLSISVTQPVSIQDGSIGIAYDSSLETIGGKLGIKIDPNGAIKSDPDGIDVSIGKGLELDEFGAIDIKIASNQPLDVSSDGISILTDGTTITTKMGTPNNQQEITIKIDENGGIESSEAGIAIKCDSTLSVDQEGLGVVCDPSGPITSDQNGLDIDIDAQSMEVTTDTTNTPRLGTKLYSNGAIIKSTNGLSIQCDRNNFDIYSNSLLLQNYVFTSGNGIGGNGFTARVMAKVGTSYITFPCAYDAKLISFNGTVQGNITIKVRSRDISGIPLDQQTTNPTFTFWLCRDTTNSSLKNFSNCSNNQFTPNKTTVISKTNPNGLNAWVTSTDQNWYLGNTSGDTIYGVPNGDGKLSGTYLYSVVFSVVQFYGTSMPRLAFTVNLTPTGANSNHLYVPDNNAAVTIGPVKFWYLI
ncbi:fiber-2 [Goose adenovirus 4]|uniref:Fiber-2 n=1 Tax=Goose adenovirus 4 TaxID=1193422 RepID=I3PMP2_9ADEN|nr:fiber-2 [Goose adenovirus 4]AFC40583.1 fiber-2 [Goose adenovirus 4]